MYKTSEYEIINGCERLQRFFCEDKNPKPIVKLENDIWGKRALFLLKSVYKCKNIPESLDWDCLIEHTYKENSISLKKYFNKVYGIKKIKDKTVVSHYGKEQHQILVMVLKSFTEMSVLKKWINVKILNKNRIEIKLEKHELFVDKVENVYVLSNREKAMTCQSLVKLYFILNNIDLIKELDDKYVNGLYFIMNGSVL